MREQCDDDASDVSEVDESEESQYETTEEEPDFLSDGVYEPETETDTASETGILPGDHFNCTILLFRK